MSDPKDLVFTRVMFSETGWTVLIQPFSSANAYNLLAIILSKVFTTHDVRLTGRKEAS